MHCEVATLCVESGKTLSSVPDPDDLYFLEQEINFFLFKSLLFEV